MNKTFSKILFFIILNSQFSIVNSQSILDNQSLVLRGHYGFISAHRERIQHIVTGHTHGFQVDFLKQTDGSAEWQQVHGYPQTGVSYVYLNLANDAILGRAHAVMGFINFPFVKKPSFRFSLHLGSGMGYLTERYTRVENHKNIAISSHLNAAIQIMPEVQFRLSRNLFLHLDYGLTHFSNGAYHVPNLGVNNLSLNAGLRYHFNYPDSFYSTMLPELNKQRIGEVFYAFGVKENYPPNGLQYFAHTLSFTIHKPVSLKSRIGFGGDVFYDVGLRQFSERNVAGDNLRAGLHVSYEMLIHKFTMVLQMGGYLYDKVPIDGNFYHRFAWQYDLTDNLFANLGLKTHFARADYVELGAGWRWYFP